MGPNPNRLLLKLSLSNLEDAFHCVLIEIEQASYRAVNLREWRSVTPVSDFVLSVNMFKLPSGSET
jgi:hypothetical protein